MSRVETGPAVTMTSALLAELAEMSAAPETPPDGYASVREIAAATGLSQAVTYDRLTECGAGYVDVRRPGYKPLRYYDLAALVAHLKQRRKR
jgi:hypothetical protein